MPTPWKMPVAFSLPSRILIPTPPHRSPPHTHTPPRGTEGERNRGRNTTWAWVPFSLLCQCCPSCFGSGGHQARSWGPQEGRGLPWRGVSQTLGSCCHSLRYRGKQEFIPHPLTWSAPLHGLTPASAPLTMPPGQVGRFSSPKRWDLKTGQPTQPFPDLPAFFPNLDFLGTAPSPQQKASGEEVGTPAPLTAMLPPREKAPHHRFPLPPKDPLPLIPSLLAPAPLCNALCHLE